MSRRLWLHDDKMPAAHTNGIIYFFISSVLVLLEPYVETTDNLSCGRIRTEVKTHGIGASGSSCLRIESRIILGKAEEIIEGNIYSDTFEEGLLHQFLRESITKLNLLDLEVSTVEYHT